MKKNIYKILGLMLIMVSCKWNGCDVWDENYYIANVENHTEDSVYVLFSHYFPDTLPPAPDVYMTYVSSFGLSRYYYLLDRDDIFSKCPKLQVFFINPDERLYYDWDKVEVIRRLEFTREELDSCGWTIVYE